MALLFEHSQDALKQGAIDAAWSDNHEHPVLMKTLFGVSWRFFHEKWDVFADASTAFRFPAMCTAGIALWTTYLFGARAWARRAGVVAAVLLGLMPRVFFHAHLACFDVPIMAMWIVCLYVHWRAQETRGIGWALWRASCTGSRSRRSTTPGFSRPSWSRTRSSFTGARSFERAGRGACRSLRASCRWP